MKYTNSEGMAREDKKKAPAGPDFFAGADDFKGCATIVHYATVNV